VSLLLAAASKALFDGVGDSTTNHRQSERPGHILQTTALVNEGWVRLVNWPDVSWQNRAHFIGLAAQLMRRIPCR
jgi:ECF sigma factor